MANTESSQKSAGFWRFGLTGLFAVAVLAAVQGCVRLSGGTWVETLASV